MMTSRWMLSRACVQFWDQQGHSSWTAEATNPGPTQKSSQAQRCAAERSDNFQVRKLVPLLVGPSSGKHAMEATATFRVAEVRDNILSLGKLVRKGFHFTLGPPWLLNGERREERAALLGLKQPAC